MLIKGAEDAFGGAWKALGLLKRAGQGERRGAVHGWPHIWTGGEGGWTMVEDDLMGILVREAARGTRQMMLLKAGDGSLGGG